MPTISRLAPPRLHARGDPQASAHASASSKFNGIIDMHVLENALREDLNKRSPARHGRAAPAQGRDRRTIPRGRSRAGGGQQSRRPQRRHAQGAVLAGALHRAGRFPRRAAEGVFPLWRRAGKCGCATATSSSCIGVVKDARPAQVIELHCTYDPATRGGNAPDGRKVQGDDPLGLGRSTPLHAEVRLYDHLFKVPDPDDVPEGEDYKANLNPDSLVVAERLPSWSRAWRRPQPAAASSSSGWATSASTRSTRVPAARCSTAPCRCATPGPRSRRKGSGSVRNQEKSGGTGFASDLLSPWLAAEVTGSL